MTQIPRIALAALLHDIGKFKQRAAFPDDEGRTHIDIGYDWLVSEYGEGLIPAAARNHHKREPESHEANLALIFYEADNCSASERASYDPGKDLGQTWHRAMRLGNVFARVRDPNVAWEDHPLSASRESDDQALPASPTMPESYWPLRPLGGWIEPDHEAGATASSEDYRRLWEAFEQEFHAVKAAGNHENVEVMLHLLEKYTAFIPSITLKITANTNEATYRKHPDVSLFDHAKLAAAAATCLYHYHAAVHRERWDRQELLIEEITGDATWDPETDVQPFMLVGGDLSGVQRFIYTISSAGALKMLKGRSFFLELLTEHVVDRLLEELGLTRCNVIFTGGGHFYLIAANIPATEEALAHVEREINDELWERFQGAVALALAACPFGKPAFRDPSAVWSAVSERLEAKKLRKWDARLSALLEEPQPPDPSCETENCRVCGREDLPLTRHLGEVEERCCEPCWLQFKLGEGLRRAVAEGEAPVLYRWATPPPARHGYEAVRIGSCYYQPAPALWEPSPFAENTLPTAVFHLNTWDCRQLSTPHSRPLLVGTALFKERKAEPPDLDALVTGGYGLSRLAVLRMDVDRLGAMFTQAVPKPERTFSRMASLSRNLSLFFTYHLNHILSPAARDGYESIPRANAARRHGGQIPARRVAVVYAGGDDVFLIGHWLDVTEAAFDIREAFSRFTGNPAMTISGGIALGSPHEPVSRLAEAAGRAEQAAKEAGRNAVTLFDRHTVSWGEARAILNLVWQVYRPLLTETDHHLSLPPWSFSQQFLYRVLALTREYRTRGEWVLPKLANLIGRCGPRDIRKPGSRAVQEAWVELKNRLMRLPTQAERDHFHQLEVATMWTLILMRKGE
ncbi:MAG: type III-A CRISPR-associated protein Cas10/Csm1 [Nitrospirae bacterium]|nr:MAG: type III-A CRISPR-associated protein Cas10/Csm1 [Nitrospirota bacterium]